jgi:hypothetical protein
MVDGDISETVLVSKKERRVSRPLEFQTSWRLSYFFGVYPDASLLSTKKLAPACRLRRSPFY